MTTESFKFNEEEDFDTNLEAFLSQLADEDPEMTEILMKHVSVLRSGTNESQRRTTITSFNESVKADLDAHGEKEEEAKK